MDVIADGFEVARGAAIDDQGLVTAAEEVAEEFVAAVEAAGVGAQEPFRAGNKVATGRLDDQMKMIGHEAPGVELPAGLLAGFIEGFQEELAIPVCLENGFATIATVHDVVHRAWVLDSEFSRHADSKAEPGSFVNTTLLGTDPLARSRAECGID